MSYYKTRKLRGMKQRMFLLGVSHTINDLDDPNGNSSSWAFQVKGTTSDYDININTESVNCNCPDYKTRGGVCKHIYFIIGRIAECSEVIDSLEKEVENGERETDLTQEEYTTVSNALISKLSSRLNSVNADVSKSKDDEAILPDLSDENCVICFEELSNDKVVQCVTEGPHCKNYFHKICLDTWLSKTPSCPLCRRLWVIKKNTTFDPLYHLNIDNIKL